MALQPIKMHFVKSTKRTHVYEAPDSFITSLYISKDAFLGIKAPAAIVVEVAIAAHSGAYTPGAVAPNTVEDSE